MNFLLASLGSTIDDQAKAQELASAAVSTLWSDIFKRGLFGEITYAFSGIAVIFLMFFFVQLVANSAEDGFEFNPSKLIYPFILTILLAQRGAVAMYLYVGTVQISNNVVARMTSRISTDLNIVSIARASQEDTEVAAKVKALFDECRLITGTNDVELKQQCITTKKATVQQMIKSGEITNPQTVNRLQSVIGMSDADIQSGRGWWDVAGAANDAFQTALRVLLFGLSVAMYYAIEMSMILVGLALPPALAFGMLGKEALVAWFTAFWSLVNMKIAYAITMAIVSYLKVALTNASAGAATQSFVIEVLAGIFSPMIATMYATANGIGIFTVLSRTALGGTASLGKGIGAGLLKGAGSAASLAKGAIGGGRGSGGGAAPQPGSSSRAGSSAKRNKPDRTNR
jgi:uncharacterized integral membrane protein